MNKPFSKHHAATGPSFSIRVSVGSLAVCCALLGGISSAAADPGNQNTPQAPQRKEDSRQPVQRAERDPRSFEARAEEHRRMMQESTNNAEMSRRVGRMTADERRDLRRQINEAGQEVYALPPRRQ